jgi:phosphoribosylamine--glycine ligase
MRILLIGSGGREHALARALARSPQRPALFVAPGNPGTAHVATNVGIDATDLDGLVAFAKDEDIHLTIVGPEQPLVAGVVDRFVAAGLPIVGPSAAAAQLEGSKAFAKAFMAKHGIPTAAHRTFEATARDEAAAYLREIGAPVVVKASGLAGGKGAIVCQTLDEALEALDRIVGDRAFGQAGDKVVVEAFMEGEEASVFALTDGEHYVLLAPSQDHKALEEGGTGPNTGGMGAYAPAPVVTGSLLTQVCRSVIEPTLAGMQARDTPYKGILYAGLMITDEGPKVVEFNCRLGDPEAQVVLPLIESDLVEVFQKLAAGRLQEVRLRGSDRHAACVVLVSGGYPHSYETGVPITGVEEAQALEGVTVIHAGTARRSDGTLVTDGGRVLGVVGTGASLEDALDRAYDGADTIDFDGKTLRRDIGHLALEK